MESSHFDGSYDHAGLLETIRNTIKRSNNEPFIGHYIGRYNIPELPPSWMVFEILSFGTVSVIYKNLKVEARKEISKAFQLSNKDLISWLHSVSVLRNMCAHHARLTNRTFRIKPRIKKDLNEYMNPNNKFNAQAVVLKYFLDVITNDSLWPDRLKTLLDEYPKLSLDWLGFEEGWHEKSFWKGN